MSSRIRWSSFAHINSKAAAIKGFVFGYLGEASNDVREEIKKMALSGAQNLWRGMGLSSEEEAHSVLQHRYTKIMGIAAVRAIARMRFRVFGVMLSTTAE